MPRIELWTILDTLLYQVFLPSCQHFSDEVPSYRRISCLNKVKGNINIVFIDGCFKGDLIQLISTILAFIWGKLLIARIFSKEFGKLLIVSKLVSSSLDNFENVFIEVSNGKVSIENSFTQIFSNHFRYQSDLFRWCCRCLSLFLQALFKSL